MKRLTFAIFALTLLWAITLAGDQKGRGKPPQKATAQHASHDGTRVAANVTFSSGDVRIIREYYAPRYQALPPGLQKKVARGGQLPPGWQKKFEPFPVEVERQLGRLPGEYRRGVIDGHAVIYSTRTQAIVDVSVLF